MTFTSFLRRLTETSAHYRRKRLRGLTPPAQKSLVRRWAFMPRLEALEDRTLPSTFTVVNLADSGHGSLRQAVHDANAAPGPNDIVFADGLRGTITLTSGELDITNDLTIHGAGQNRLTVSGDNASRVFAIRGSSTNVEIDDLTIANGRASDTVVVGHDGPDTGGGGILNYSGHLTVSHVTFRDNQADGQANGFSAGGGAIANLFGASLTVTHNTFVDNRAIGDFHGYGGAIGNDVASTLSVEHSTFTGNQAVTIRGNGPGDVEGDASGGAIENIADSQATVSHSTFIDNQAHGGNGGGGGIADGGEGEGGALHNSALSTIVVDGGAATMTVEYCNFFGNQAVGGPGEDGGSGQNGGDGGLALGGAVGNGNSTMTIEHSTFFDNQAIAGRGGNGGAGGNGGSGGEGDGGAIIQSIIDPSLPAPILNLNDVTLVDNRAIGGAGGNGGTGANGGDGGVGTAGGLGAGFGGALTMSHSVLIANQAIAGAGGAPGAGGSHGGNGGNASAGGIRNAAGTTAMISDTVLLLNRAQGGAGGLGANGGNGQGGGIKTDGPSPFGTASLTLTRCTIVDNEADGGAAGEGGSAGLGQGGGVYVTPGGIASKDRATVIKHNHASTSDDNVFGNLTER